MKDTIPLYQALITALNANDTGRLHYMEREYLPSGSGFDSGSSVDDDRYKRNRLVLTTQYHHMDSNGYYIGWTSHEVIITPEFLGHISVTVKGRNVDDLKGYIANTFYDALMREIEYPAAE